MQRWGLGPGWGSLRYAGLPRHPLHGGGPRRAARAAEARLATARAVLPRGGHGVTSRAANVAHGKFIPRRRKMQARPGNAAGTAGPRPLSRRDRQAKPGRQACRPDRGRQQLVGLPWPIGCQAGPALQHCGYSFKFSRNFSESGQINEGFQMKFFVATVSNFPGIFLRVAGIMRAFERNFYLKLKKWHLDMFFNEKYEVDI